MSRRFSARARPWRRRAKKKDYDFEITDMPIKACCVPLDQALRVRKSQR